MSGPGISATAIVPVKRFGQAKQRLLETLDRRQRAAIIRAMLTDVLASICAATRIERLIVVTGEQRAERIALERAKRATTQVEVMRDPDDRGHSEAATLGIVRALALGAGCTALLPGDCPLLDPDELDRALERMVPGRVAIVPDRHGTGTNALVLAPGDAIGPAFGDGSMERHRDRATRAGHQAAVEPLESLALDLDTPEDLGALATELALKPQRAPATAAELAKLGPLVSRGRS